MKLNQNSTIAATLGLDVAKEDLKLVMRGAVIGVDGILAALKAMRERNEIGGAELAHCLERTLGTKAFDRAQVLNPNLDDDDDLLFDYARAIFAESLREHGFPGFAALLEQDQSAWYDLCEFGDSASFPSATLSLTELVA